MKRLLCALACTASMLGCAAFRSEPDLALLYNPSAQHHGPYQNPIITIPGILGSMLRDTETGVLAWGAFEPGAADPDDSDGARLIALPLADVETLAELRDSVEPDGVLELVRIKFAGVPVEIQAYAGILATLGAGGYRDEALGLAGEIDYGDDHFTCFQFDYDWRRDNVENARRLHDFILEKRKIVRREIRDRYGVDRDDIQFDIAAHSMGGLLTRYFLMYGSQDLPADGTLPELTWEGADLVDRVVFVGTPNAGSATALMELVEGSKIGPLLPFYPPALMGTFPSVYQLLPRPRHGVVLEAGPEPVRLDLFDPSVWQRHQWGLADPRQAGVLATLMPDTLDAAERKRVALKFQTRALERARDFAAAIDRPAEKPPGLEFFLVAGDAAPTASRIEVGPNGVLDVVARAPGDGTVLRSSALLDERVGGVWQARLKTPIDFDSVLFLPDSHLGLTRSPTFRDNILFWLLERP